MLVFGNWIKLFARRQETCSRKRGFIMNRHHQGSKQKNTAGMLMPRIWRFRTDQSASKIWPSACFVNKVLMKHSHAHLFTYCLWLLLLYNVRAEQLWYKTNKYKLKKIKYSFSSFLQKKFADLGFSKGLILYKAVLSARYDCTFFKNVMELCQSGLIPQG